MVVNLGRMQNIKKENKMKHSFEIMEFDFTKSKKIKYCVTLYKNAIDEHMYDVYYFYYYREAKEFFDSIQIENGLSVRMYDVQKDRTMLFKSFNTKENKE